jgi:galactose mutarotase-like enzyme
LATFPFPHELRVEVALAATTLRMTTTVTPTTDQAVPISFGYHPYLHLPGVRREDVRLRLPARRHLELDSRGLPTGVARAEDAEDEPIGSRRFDDLYEVAADRRLALTGGGRHLTVELEDGYRFAQVFTPPAAASVCLEPMTAAVNALVDGGYPLVSPGASFTARFSLHVEDVS